MCVHDWLQWKLCKIPHHLLVNAIMSEWEKIIGVDKARWKVDLNGWGTHKGNILTSVLSITVTDFHQGDPSSCDHVRVTKREKKMQRIRLYDWAEDWYYQRHFHSRGKKKRKASQWCSCEILAWTGNIYVDFRAGWVSVWTLSNTFYVPLPTAIFRVTHHPLANAITFKWGEKKKKVNKRKEWVTARKIWHSQRHCYSERKKSKQVM